MPAIGSNQALFNVCSEQRGHGVELRLSGELDVATTPVLEFWLRGAESNGNTSIVLDLELLTFMDASGLHSFLRAAARATRGGREFSIVGASPVAQRLFEITQTTHLLGTVAPSLPRVGGMEMIAVAR